MKLFIARFLVSRFTKENVDWLAVPLAANRSWRQLLFTEYRKLQVYFK